MNYTTQAPVEALTETITVSGSEQSLLGGGIPVGGNNTLILYLDIDINDSQNLVLVPYALVGSDEYRLPSQGVTASTGEVLVNPAFITLGTDSDLKQVFCINIDTHVPGIDVKIYTGTVGTTPAQITSCMYSLGQN